MPTKSEVARAVNARIDELLVERGWSRIGSSPSYFMEVEGGHRRLTLCGADKTGILDVYVGFWHNDLEDLADEWDPRPDPPADLATSVRTHIYNVIEDPRHRARPWFHFSATDDPRQLAEAAVKDLERYGGPWLSSLGDLRVLHDELRNLLDHQREWREPVASFLLGELDQAQAELDHWCRTAERELLGTGREELDQRFGEYMTFAERGYAAVAAARAARSSA